VLGYHFFSAKNNKGATVLVVSRNRSLGDEVLYLIRLSDYLWLDSGRPPPSGADGYTARDST
jgi:hypothetical protein